MVRRKEKEERDRAAAEGGGEEALEVEREKLVRQLLRTWEQ
jgi:hypothetical protein